MKKILFWKRVSDVSIAICLIMIIVKMFFRSYIPNFSIVFLIIGGVALLTFLLSEVMKIILKRTK